MRHLKLKVCGMREPANIAEVGALRPDYVGFIFVKSSPRYVGDALKPAEISLSPSVIQIGVFQDAPLSAVAETVRAFSLGGVQLHGNEDAAYMRDLKAALPSLLIIKAVKVQSSNDIAQLQGLDGVPDLFLLDGKNPGSGEPFNWDLLRSYTAKTDFLLAGGIGAEDIPEVVKLAAEIPNLAGVDINSRVESAPGLKDIIKIKHALERLRV